MKFLHARKFWFTLSIVLTLAGVFGLYNYGLRTGIDFKGGQVVEAQFIETVEIDDVRQAFNKENILEKFKDQDKYPDIKEFPEVSVAASKDSFILRNPELSQTQLKAFRETLDALGEWQEIRFETVGPKVSSNLAKKAIIGVSAALVFIVLYIAWAFRRVPPPSNSWQFGIATIITLAHDIFIAIGAFAFFGHYFGYEVDSLFITALLTILGFSVHDTIIAFDRIRENLKESKEDFETIVEKSIEQTVTRSLNTSVTLILVLLSLLLLGGASLKPFVAALLIGVSTGTYSSICVAPQILVIWPKKRKAA